MKTSRIAGSQFSAADSDLAALLRDRFRAAIRRNPRFSLRSFARQLGVDHSTISQVLRGKRRLSARDAIAAGKRLGLTAETIRLYNQVSRKTRKPVKPLAEIRSVQVDLDTFQFLSSWHHSAILELLQVAGFTPDSRWLARTLGVSVEEVNVALQRLMRLGLLEMATADRWLDKSGDSEFQTQQLTETASNRVSEEVHRLAIDALKRVPIRCRIQDHMIIALHSAQLSRLKILTGEFISELRSLAAESASKDDVFQVEVSVFPITTLNQSKGDKNA